MAKLQKPTCYGLGCLSMKDLYDFIVDVKELDMYGKSRKKCCFRADRDTTKFLIDGNCDCTSEWELPREEQCIFGRCMSWAEWKVITDWIDKQVDNSADADPTKRTGIEKISFDMMPTLLAALGYQGMNGNGPVIPEFYNNAAEVGSIIAGATAAVFAGKDVVKVAVRNEKWKQRSTSIAAVFNNYGGISIVQILLFLIEAFWTVATFTQVAEIGLAPFVLSYLMQTHFTALSAQVGDEMSTVYLMWSFLIAFGSFIGAWAIRQSCNVMVGYYDITDTKEFQDYLALKGGLFDINMKRGMFIADLFSHGIMLLAYGALAAGVQTAAFAYVYFSITGQEIDLTILDL